EGVLLKTVTVAAGRECMFHNGGRRGSGDVDVVGPSVTVTLVGHR
ncbi:hypothetical protein A2U01_0114720, partial [Trifolium medium]|nr:hypothetical protein [Trifolium medium]